MKNQKRTKINVYFYFYKKELEICKKDNIMNISNDDLFLIFGYIGSANACLMMIPQIHLTIKKKTMEDISMQTICLNLLTQCLFLPYTVHNKLYPFLTVNIFLGSFDIVLIIFYLFLINKENNLTEPLLNSTNI